MKKKKGDDYYDNGRAREIPTLRDVQTALQGVTNIDFMAEDFFDYYEATGWIIGGKVVCNWKALLRKWIRHPRRKMAPTTKHQAYSLGDIEEQVKMREERLNEQKRNAVTREEYLRMKEEGRL